MTKEEEEQTKEMEDFLKKAFCIDGRCEHVEDFKVNIILKNTTSAMFMIVDSKRGKFFVTISK